MLRILVDNDFNERILRGVQSRTEIDAVLARAVGLEDKPDPELLSWAAVENRIILSHDLQTMPVYAITRVRGGQPMPGLILVPQELRIGKAVEELTMIALCSDQGEWRNMIVYVPL